MQAMKTCFKCGRCLPLGDFYKHPAMADGHLGKCKVCTIADVIARQAVTRPERAAYERKRFQDPRRKSKVVEYARKSRIRNPEKAKARRILGYYVRSGKLIRKPCEVCGEVRSQAHHTDYSKPLDVQWLCFRCHRVYGHGQTLNEPQHEHS